MMKYFMITCHRGHCGTGRSSEIKFAFRARNLLDAMDRAKRMPSVQHTRMIMSGKEISWEEYHEYRAGGSAYDRFPQGRANI